MRPVVNFDTCIKCELCGCSVRLLLRRDAEGLYDANMAACCGCGVCEAVCPVGNCVTMVSEIASTQCQSMGKMWRRIGRLR